jgi:uncharacterized tellurite resistance protein B-like protein
MNAKEELTLLIQLAKVDDNVVQQETDMIYYLGTFYGLTKETIDALFESSSTELDINSLSKEDKYNCIYDLIHLMKVDQMVFQSEIQFCQKIASTLGYKTDIVPELAAHIFSDSDITINKLALREMADKYLNS